MQVGYILYEDLHGKSDVASSRIRGKWLIDKWNNAEKYINGKKYDAIVYQKAYLVSHAKRYDGIKILDICDPDWNSYQNRVIEFIQYVDGITCPTEAIKEYLSQITDKPIYVVPDRQNLDYFPDKKVHTGRATEVCWFGYSHNSYSLKSIRDLLDKHKLKISIITDKLIYLNEDRKRFKFEERFTKWNLNTVNTEIIKSDFVVMPGSNDPNYKFKSNNKTTHAWALKMPVAQDVVSFVRLLDEQERIKESEARYKEVLDKYDVKLSVKEMENIIHEVDNRKKKN